MAICSFVLDPDDLKITHGASQAAAQTGSEPEQTAAKPTAEDPGYGIFEPENTDAVSRPAVAAAEAAKTEQSAAEAKNFGRRATDKEGNSQESSSIRVGIEKVDQLINLVGELVITQAMIEQRIGALDPDPARTPAQQRRPADPEYARPAGSGHVDPHDADGLRVLALPAHGARPGSQTGQEGRLHHTRRRHRTRQGADRAHCRSADPSGAQQRRSRHRNAREAPCRRQERNRQADPVGRASGRQYRDRGERRWRRPESRQDSRQGQAAGPAGIGHDARRRCLAAHFRPRFFHRGSRHRRVRPWRRHGRGQAQHCGDGRHASTSVPFRAPAPPLPSRCR